MTTPAPFGTRLTVEAIAPLVDGALRPAHQPLGTWLSRWACLYTDTDLAPSGAVHSATDPLHTLPHYPAAA